MTISTQLRTTMIQWFVRKRRMAEFIRREAVGVMALITFLLRNKVTSVPANRSHSVVAGRTRPEHLVVIHGCHGRPRNG